MYRICLVEDEQSLRDTISLNLELEGYAVEACADGAIAHRLFSGPIHFDLVILDVMLPNVTGFDLCKEIRKHSAVPVLFLSAADWEPIVDMTPMLPTIAVRGAITSSHAQQSANAALAAIELTYATSLTPLSLRIFWSVATVSWPWANTSKRSSSTRRR